MQNVRDSKELGKKKNSIQEKAGADGNEEVLIDEICPARCCPLIPMYKYELRPGVQFPGTVS